VILAVLFTVPTYFITRHVVVTLRNRNAEPAEPSP
jgi:hypothetical protein